MLEQEDVMYSDRLQSFYRDRSAVGELAQPTFRVTRSNVLCGDSLTLTGIVHDGCLIDLKFTATGCMLCQAAASALVSMTRGQRCSFIQQLKLQDVLAVLEISVGPTRQQCVALALDALQQALAHHA